MKPPRHDSSITRRDFVARTTAVAATALAATLGRETQAGGTSAGTSTASGKADGVPSRPLLTPAGEFRDVSRGNPRPHTLSGESLVQARLTPETWRLEITPEVTSAAGIKEEAGLARALTLAEGTALDLAALLELGRKHEVRFFKAMQCLNIPAPLGQGLWEGVPLREVLRLCGAMRNVRRVYYWGFHNQDPRQRFQSSLS